MDVGFEGMARSDSGEVEEEMEEPEPRSVMVRAPGQERIAIPLKKAVK